MCFWWGILLSTASPFLARTWSLKLVLPAGEISIRIAERELANDHVGKLPMRRASNAKRCTSCLRTLQLRLAKELWCVPTMSLCNASTEKLWQYHKKRKRNVSSYYYSNYSFSSLLRIAWYLQGDISKSQWLIKGQFANLMCLYVAFAIQVDWEMVISTIDKRE